MKLKLKILVLLATVLIVAGGIKTLYNRIMEQYFPNLYQQEIRKYAKENDLDVYFVKAVINTESGFDPNAHSGVAKGLMQITDETAMWISEKTGSTYYEDMAYEPEVNIQMGCWYLRYLIDRYKNVDTALCAYNAGMGNVDKWLSDRKYSADGKTLRNIPFPETANYVLRVRKMMGIYQKAY